MDISLLKIFAAVAEAESISKAAQRLDYVQSNVTARIQQLEEDLGTPLFYRKKRGMILTPAGRILLEYTKRILRLFAEARKAVQDSEQVQGTLALGSMETTAAVRLPAILTQYHQAYPDVEITLLTGPSEELVAHVLDYKVDGAFVGGSVTHPDIEQERIFHEELVFVTERRVDSLATMQDCTLLTFRQGCSYRVRLEKFLREHGGIVPYKIMEFGTFEAILGCVAAGMGVTLFPRSAMMRSPYVDQLRLHTLPEQFALVPTMFIRRKDTIRTRALAAFLQTARQDNTPSVPANGTQCATSGPPHEQ